jgi:hypothetical protein
VYSLHEDDSTFIFSEVGAPDDADLGFADSSSTTGGYLAGTLL